MTPLQRAVARFLGLWAVLAGVELLERVAYRAGALDGDRAARELPDYLRPVRPVVDEDLADDELEAVNVSDVVLAHVKTFHGPDAPRAGECAC